MPLRQKTRCNQRGLFDDDKTCPGWEALPLEARQTASKLLMQLFLDHLTRRAGEAARSEEVAGE